MALLRQGRQRLRLLSRGTVQFGQRCFSAEPAPADSNDNITVKVNPFKGHRIEPPSQDVQTNKKELLEMFEVCTLHASL